MEDVGEENKLSHGTDVPEETPNTCGVEEGTHETTSLINNENYTSQPDEENVDLDQFEDHPLRALSYLSIGAESSCDSAISCPSHLSEPEVHIQVPNKSVRYKFPMKSNRNESEEVNVCIPLSAVFRPEIAPLGDENGNANEYSPFGYKNWLIHLGRRRRCEILILVGFLMWLAFFLVLALVLNGNSSSKDSEADSDSMWKDINVGQTYVKTGNTTHKNETDDQPTVEVTPPVTEIERKGKLFDASTKPDEFIGGKNTTHKNEPNSQPTVEVTLAQKQNHFYTTKPNLKNLQSNSTTTYGDNKNEAAPVTEVEKKDNSFNASTKLYELIEGKNMDEVSVKASQDKSNYLIGVSRADMTGPAADINMMGYANPSQKSGGVHMRQFARAFIVVDRETKTRTVFVNIDACMGTTLLKLEVLKQLKQKFGNLYTAENLCISGTHTHSAPAGFLQDALFQISSLGYVDETLVAMVTGIVKSIAEAHKAIQPGYILTNKGELVGSNINRSPMAYLMNPSEERSKYKHDVDTEMVLLKFMNEKDEGIGMINWFPVHCTSMNNTNSLISGDNKGYAELLFEKYMDPNSLLGTSKFVAAFAQSNEGDVSPNTKGPHCLDTGEKCDNMHSTCNGKSQLCVASGPGKNMFESTKIIGNNQFETAKRLYENADVVIKGPVKFIHQYIDMTKYEVVVNDTVKVKTCEPAMGFSFAAGTTDGPGAFDFKQGDVSGSKFWNVVRNFLHSPSEEQKKCHAPKPILLDTGEMSSPYDWQPRIVATQVVQIGQFIVLALPGEFTTMAGRRLREGVLDVFKKHNSDTKFEAVIAGLSNTYSDYITTFEEYQIQRYEGASTIYGPYTAKAYKQQYEKLANSLLQNKIVKSTVFPTNNKDQLYEFQTGVYYDTCPFGYNYGDILEDVKSTYTQGDRVSVKFVAGNPRSCLNIHSSNSTFLIVQQAQADFSWKIIYTDVDWETRFIWERPSSWLPSALRSRSEATIIWDTDKDTPPGHYRIAHYGCYKNYHIYPYSGQSSTFTIKKV